MHTNRNRLLWLAPLVLALFGCGGGGGDAPAGDPQAQGAGAPAQPATIPAPLTGQWETVLTYVPPFYSGPYGLPDGDGAIGITLVMTADGRYRHIWTLTSAYFGGNCFRTGGWDEFGTVSGGAGADFTFTPTKASYIQTDTCGQNKFLDPAPVAPGSHALKLEQDNTGWPLLRVTFPTGDIVLEKCRRCG